VENVNHESYILLIREKGRPKLEDQGGKPQHRDCPPAKHREDRILYKTSTTTVAGQVVRS
jgi:hypothetical protein